MVKAARDAMFERRPFLTVSAQLEGGSVVLLAEALPVLAMPMQDFYGGMSENPLLELHPGGREGTVELTVNFEEGKKSCLISGLDLMVPLDAGALTMPPEGH